MIPRNRPFQDGAREQFEVIGSAGEVFDVQPGRHRVLKMIEHGYGKSAVVRADRKYSFLIGTNGKVTDRPRFSGRLQILQRCVAIEKVKPRVRGADVRKRDQWIAGVTAVPGRGACPHFALDRNQGNRVVLGRGSREPAYEDRIRAIQRPRRRRGNGRC